MYQGKSISITTSCYPLPATYVLDPVSNRCLHGNVWNSRLTSRKRKRKTGRLGCRAPAVATRGPQSPKPPWCLFLSPFSASFPLTWQGTGLPEYVSCKWSHSPCTIRHHSTPVCSQSKASNLPVVGQRAVFNILKSDFFFAFLNKQSEQWPEI